MKSIDRWPASASAGAEPVDPFERLRAAYFARLHADGLQLIALRERLGDDADGLRSTHECVRRVAHRMGGAAAVFEAPAILCAATALEEAAIVSLTTARRSAPEGVRRSIDSLLAVLASVHGGASSPAR